MPERRRGTQVLLHGASADRVTAAETEARLRARERLAGHPEVLKDRTCACGTKLSQYNIFPMCQPCERTQRMQDLAVAHAPASR